MQYRYDDFNSCIDQPFALELDDASVLLTLVSVDRLGNSASVNDRDVFSVIFRGDNDRVLQQQIYRISNDTLGEMDLFIVPIGPDEQGMRYEAVFS